MDEQKNRGEVDEREDSYPSSEVKKKEEGTIWKELEATDFSIERLEKNLCGLQTRLRPVSKPETPEESTDKESSDQPEMPAVAQRLSSHRRRIAGLSRLARHIIDQLEI